ncbi:hypothetical protein [Paenibacillus chungangensis]|uniref:Uncharacterized protein n=1 Tax=Paenibacillus chungangensis TaxID=696535 RepID=A0ABW3HS14_9BACL
MKGGISDIGIGNTFSIQNKEVISTSGDTVNFQMKEFKTVQLLDTKVNYAERVNTYAITTINDYDKFKYKGNDWDGSIGIEAYSTVYINETVDNRGGKYYDLVRVTGGWNRADTSLNVKDQSVRIGQVGTTADSLFVQNYKDYNPSRLTYSYEKPVSFEPVLVQAYMILGD